ncbi:hypothetical protein DSECCO2_121420 [anaerobic digester metagenome]
MKKIRRGNDFVFAWEIERNGLPEDLSSVLEKHLYLSALGKRVELVEGVDYDITGNVVRIEVTPAIATILGTYKAEFHYILPDLGLIDEDRKCAVDVNAFVIVGSTEQADNPSEFSITSDMAIAFKGDKGDKGDKGEKGDKGDAGTSNTLSIGTVTGGINASASITGIAPNQTLNLVLPKGEKGDTGPKGDTGLKGDTGAKGEKGDSFIYSDFTPEQLALLVGEKGDKGDPFTYADFTPEQIAELKQPAMDAAQQADTAATAANTAAGLADTARLAIQDDLASKADQTELDQLAGDVEQLAYVKIKNEAVNGNLENGLIEPFSRADVGEGASTLTINSSTPISGNYDIRFTIITPGGNGRPLFYGLNRAANIGDKIYLHFYAKILSGIPMIKSIHNGASDLIIYGGNVINGRNTRIIDVVGTGNAGLIYFSSPSVWDMQMDNFMRINLTETFGAGNEPTEEEMNLLISILGTGYFEGEITIPAQKIMQWQLKLIRKNKNAIIALGGTII